MRWPVSKNRLNLVFVLLMLSGCAHQSLNPQYGGPRPLPDKFRRAFAYYREKQASEQTIRRQSGVYTVYRHQWPAGRGRIEIDRYQPQNAGRLPVILLIPILGGDNPVAVKFAGFLAENRFAAVIVHRRSDFKQSFHLDRVDEISRQAVTDIRRTVDWICTRDDLDSTRIGILGVSLGSITAAMTLAVEPRIRAGVLMLVAGDLPYILTYSAEKRIREKRVAYMTDQGVAETQLHARLRETIGLDPMVLAPYTDAGQVLMMLALFDRVVPFRKGRELRERMGGPETFYLVSGHYTAGIYLHWARRAALSFFEKRLGAGPV